MRKNTNYSNKSMPSMKQMGLKFKPFESEEERQSVRKKLFDDINPKDIPQNISDEDLRKIEFTVNMTMKLSGCSKLEAVNETIKNYKKV